MFPTCVGMNRGIKHGVLLIPRVPHVCGDEPSQSIMRCSLRGVPTCVGMNGRSERIYAR